MARSRNLIRGFLMEPVLFTPQTGPPYWRYRSIEKVINYAGDKRYILGDIKLDPIRGVMIGEHFGGVTKVTFGKDFGQKTATTETQRGQVEELAPAKANGGTQIRTYLEIRPTPIMIFSAGTTAPI